MDLFGGARCRNETFRRAALKLRMPSESVGGSERLAHLQEHGAAQRAVPLRSVRKYYRFAVRGARASAC